MVGGAGGGEQGEMVKIREELMPDFSLIWRKQSVGLFVKMPEAK